VDGRMAGGWSRFGFTNRGPQLVARPTEIRKPYRTP
jgi:hypothetical protein